MAEKRAIDIALHWLPGRGQYRFRFMRYGGGFIYCWYYYFPQWISSELHSYATPKKVLFFLAVLSMIGFFVIAFIWVPYLFLTGGLTG